MTERADFTFVVKEGSQGKPWIAAEQVPGGGLICFRKLTAKNGAFDEFQSGVLSHNFRILKFWLRGPRAGEWFDFVTGTRGFPDNISLSDSGLVWVSLPAPRVPVLDFMLPRHPILRQSVLRVPQRLHPQAEEVVWVQAYDLDGKLVHDIKTKHPRLSFITAVAESGGTVWLGIMGSLW